jgi:cyclopropane fatty-acyl-phospholipid synthase-like methyltransferase
MYTNIYDYFFGDTNFKLATPLLFYNTINKIEPNSKVLDFGCGNGICYSNTLIKKSILSNNLTIEGIDIDKVYIKKCKQRIIDENLNSNVTIRLMDVFDYEIKNEEERFDYIIFSESAPVLSDELLTNIINHVIKNLVKTNGKIVFINNLTNDENTAMIKIKPLLKYICMIEFGRVLTQKDFEDKSKQFNKNIKVNLIDKMKLKEVLRYFYLEWGFSILNMYGVNDYDIEQYEIIFF